MPGSIIIQMILHNPSLIQTLLSVLESHQISCCTVSDTTGRGLYRRLGITPDPEELLFHLCCKDSTLYPRMQVSLHEKWIHV